MAELKELYQQVILDHNRSPRNFHVPEGANREARGDNPLCGDKITVYARVSADGTIEEVGFQGSGCAISQASASLMTSAVKGKSTAEAEELFGAFHDMVTGERDAPTLPKKLMAFAGVKEFPARVKCANLPWHTLHAALQNTGEAATTE